MLIQCTICVSSVSPSDSTQSTPCGHVFHTPCLDQWLQRSSTCPQCRTRCSGSTIRRLYFSSSMNNSTADTETIQMQLDDAKLEIRNLKSEVAAKENLIKNMQTTQKQSKDTIISLESNYKLEKRKSRESKMEIDYLRKEVTRLCDLENELKEKTVKLEQMDHIVNVIDAAHGEVEAILKEGSSSQCLATMVIMLKRQLTNSETKRLNHLKALQSKYNDLKASKVEIQDKVSSLESDNNKLKDDLSQLQNTLDTLTKNTENKEDSMSPLHPTVKPLESIASNSSLKIVSSNSPYLNIKQSNVGLSPLLKRKLATLKTKDDTDVKDSKQSTYKNLSIFNNPRKILRAGSSLRNPSLVYNGIGGTERKENFVGFPQAQTKK